MNIRRTYVAALGLFSLALSLLCFTTTANAQSNGVSGNGDALRVSPVRLETTIAPGTSKVIDVMVSNLTQQQTTYKAIVNDFGAGDDETGQAKIYLDDKGKAPSHGLKQYISPVSDVTLKAGEQKTVRVSLTIPKDAAGGGYYGVVRFAPSGSSGEKIVNLSGSVGTLLLVTVPGDVTEQAAIASFNVARMDGDQLGKASSFFTNGKKDSDGKGLQAVVRIRSTGNVQVAPFGKVILKKGGKEIANYEINNTQPRGNVLPDSTRRFMVDLQDKTSSFGKYTLEGNFGYGSKGQLVSASTTFFVVPLAYSIAAVVLIVAIIAAIFIFPRMMKAHDRKLLRKVRTGKRR